MTILIIVYIAQAVIVSFLNEVIVYVPKRKRSKVRLWLRSKVNIFICLISKEITWIEELSTNCRKKGKRDRKDTKEVLICTGLRYLCLSLH